MDASIVVEYIRKRMIELGYGDNYYLRIRHIVLHAAEIFELGGSDHLYILMEQVEGVTIESTFGYFDLGDTGSNELQYEHQGKIKITNYSTDICHVRFLQAIPKKQI